MTKKFVQKFKMRRIRSAVHPSDEAFLPFEALEVGKQTSRGSLSNGCTFPGREGGGRGVGVLGADIFGAQIITENLCQR